MTVIARPLLHGMARAAIGWAAATLLLASTVTPAAAATGRDVRTALVASVEPCKARVSNPQDSAALSRCARDLVAPDTRDPYIFDLFRTFTYCLWEASGSDSMYPGVDPREVNICLERHGF